MGLPPPFPLQHLWQAPHQHVEETSDDQSKHQRDPYEHPLNPDVESMAVISSDQRDEINKNAAALLQKLITVTCRTEVQKAVKYEGPQTIQQAFQVFGQVAGRELMTSPRVAEGMVGLEKYIDEKKMKDVMIGDTSK